MTTGSPLRLLTAFGCEPAKPSDISGEAPVRVICTTELSRSLLAPSDVRADGEEEVEAALVQAKTVWATTAMPCTSTTTRKAMCPAQ